MRLTAQNIQDFLNVDLVTGLLTWKSRPLASFANKRTGKTWNTRYAGTLAFNYVGVNGYCEGKLLGIAMRAHQIVWIASGRPMIEEIDHINGIRSDNRLENLRSVSHKENTKNASLGKRNTSGVVGVFWAKKSRRWAAQITTDEGKKHLGHFVNIEDAIAARNEASRKNGFYPLHGKPKAGRAKPPCLPIAEERWRRATSRAETGAADRGEAGQDAATKQAGGPDRGRPAGRESRDTGQGTLI